MVFKMAVLVGTFGVAAGCFAVTADGARASPPGSEAGALAGKPAGRFPSFVEQTARQDNWTGGPREEDGLPLVVTQFGDIFYRSERVGWSKPNVLTPYFSVEYEQEVVAPTVNYPPKIMEIGDFGGSPGYDFFVAYGGTGSGAFGIYDESGNMRVEKLPFGNNGSINDAFIFGCDADADLDIIVAGTDVSGGEFVWYSQVGDYDFELKYFDYGILNLLEPSGVLAGNFVGNFASVIGCDAQTGSIYLFNYYGTTFEYADTILDSGLPGCGPMAAADFDDDGMLDFVVGSSLGGIRWFRNLGGGRFEGGTIADNVAVEDVCTGYVNDDPYPDVIAINDTGKIVWWDWTGSGFGDAGFIDESGVFGPGSTLAAGDIDPGIRFELCAASKDGGFLYSYFTEDGDYFLRIEVVGSYSTPSDVVIADRDGDAFGDVLTCSFDEMTIDSFLYRKTYLDGWLESSIYDTEGEDTAYYKINFDGTLLGNIEVRCRTMVDPDNPDQSPWSAALGNGQDLGSVPEIRKGEPYVQYRVDFLPTEPNVDSPEFRWIEITYDPEGAPPDVPQVDYTTPGKGETDVSLNSNVIVFFTLPMDEDTFRRGETVFLNDGTTDLPWQGSYRDEGELHTLTIDPDQDFAPGATITLTITDGATDKDGTPLDGDFNGKPGGTFETVFYTGTESDDVGPSVADIAAVPNPYGESLVVTVTATISDAGDPGTSAVVGGDSWVGDEVNREVEFVVIPADGYFDEEEEEVVVVINVADLPPGDAQEVYLLGRDQAGNEGPAESITISRGLEFLPADYVYAYPNPSYGDHVDFYYYVSKSGNIVVGVYDLRGRKVEEVSKTVPGAIVDSVGWDCGAVAPGVYVFRLTAVSDDGETAAVTKKFALIR